jgi:threonine/homoserine/homoserine lactone efflux protein
MCDPQTLFAFALASAAIILAPGPAQALVLSRTIEGGRKAGMLTAIGLNAATLVHAAAAGVGLSAVLAQSALAFGVVKFLGAGYLVYLGVRALASANEQAPSQAEGQASPTRAFGQAFLTGLLNPKWRCSSWLSCRSSSARPRVRSSCRLSSSEASWA